MAKKYILTIKQIYKNRAAQWEFHYKQRETVKQISSSLDTHRVITVIQNHIPAPELLIDATLLHGMPHRKGRLETIDTLHWKLTFANMDLLCIWYWTADYWQDFIRAFQALPDPIFEDYFYAYDAELDALRFLPVSYRTVDKSVDKFGGSKRVPPKGTGNSHHTHIRAEVPLKTR